jgi:hypothetical protein
MKNLTAPLPVHVYVFGNGMCMVFDQYGQQMPELQGTAIESAEKLRIAGYHGPIHAAEWRQSKPNSETAE